MFKKIISSKLLKILVSVILIYLAFRKVDILSILGQLTGIKIWFLVVNILVSLFLIGLVSYRWSLLLIKKPKVKDIVIFTKSSLSASFTGLFFPSAVAGDILKWIIIDEKYPDIPKSKILGSVLLDRFIGMTMFVVFGFVMVLLNKEAEIPTIIKLIFGCLFLGCVIFYIAIVFFDVSKIFKFKWFKKIKNISELVSKDNLGQIWKSILVSLVGDIFWVFQLWFIGWYFGTNLSIMSIFIFLPIISTILVLPISIAGFGAREQLFLLFFGPMATSNESVLLMSTFWGILGIINCLFGGLVTLTPDFRQIKIKS